MKLTLPVNNILFYDLTVPSTKKKVKYRPYLVKEQKQLLLAQQSENISTMIDAMKNVIKECVKDNIDVDKLAMFDLEYIFTQIRAMSSGEISELLFKCPNDECEGNDKAAVKIQIDLTKLKVDIPETFTNTLQLSDDIGVVLDYPSIDIAKRLESIDSETEALFEIILDIINQVYDKNNVYNANDYTREELSDWLSQLTELQLSKIIEFIQGQPKLTHKVEWTCPVCTTQHTTILEGLDDFF